MAASTSPSWRGSAGARLARDKAALRAVGLAVLIELTAAVLAAAGVRRRGGRDVITVVLALAAAVAYGSSDFIGGLVSRRGSAWSVAVVVQLSSAVVATVRPSSAASRPRRPRLGRARRRRLRGRRRVPLPRPEHRPDERRGAGQRRRRRLLPVAVGVALGGWPPVAVVLAVLTGIPGIWLVSRVSDAGTPTPGDARQAGAAGSGLTDGLLAGVGFGVLFAALDQVSDGAGLWATAVTQGASTVTAVVLAVAHRQRLVAAPPRGRGPRPGRAR